MQSKNGLTDKRLIENYEFPCIGAWGGYVCSKLKKLLQL